MTVHSYPSESPEAFWAQQAEQIVWRQKPTQIVEGEYQNARWFSDGQLSVIDTCLSQHLETHRRNKTAIVWEGERGEIRKFSYLELFQAVSRAAHLLKQNGIKKGDRVAIYMPLIPEAVVAMLACAYVGATHTVIFAGFSPQSITDRVNDSQCKAIITADGGWRKGQILHLKDAIDNALSNERCPSVEHVFVWQHAKQTVQMHSGRDKWWHEELSSEDEQGTQAETVDSNHPPVHFVYVRDHREAEGSCARHRRLSHTSGRHRKSGV